MENREETVQRLGRTSRIVTLCYLGLAVVGFGLARTAAAWLIAAGNVLLGLAGLAFCASWFMPAIFVLRRTPWYALAWLEGANPFARVKTRWEQLSDWSRLMLHLVALLLAGFMLVIIINVAAALLRG